MSVIKYKDPETGKWVTVGGIFSDSSDSGENAGFVVQDTEPEDTSVLWVDPSDNSDDGFQEAVNAALAQAKASGEFDGKPGKDGADGKDGVVAVTGATVGQTVKISAVDENGVPTVWEPTDFPSGGGSGGSTYWKKVASAEITDAETARVYITQDIDGNPLNIDKTHKWQVLTTNANYSANGYVDLQLNKYMTSGTTASVALRLTTYQGSDCLWFSCEPFLEGQLFIRGLLWNSGGRNIRQAFEIPTSQGCYDGENITKIGINLKSGTYFTVGTVISIYEEVSA